MKVTSWMVQPTHQTAEGTAVNFFHRHWSVRGTAGLTLVPDALISPFFFYKTGVCKRDRNLISEKAAQGWRRNSFEANAKPETMVRRVGGRAGRIAFHSEICDLSCRCEQRLEWTTARAGRDQWAAARMSVKSATEGRKRQIRGHWSCMQR